MKQALKRTNIQLLTIGIILTFAFLQVSVLRAQTAACPTLPAHTGSSTGTVNISEQGTYKVWTRMMVPNTKHNSYWLQIDDACGINVGDSDTIAPDTWTWVAYEDGDSTQTIARDLAQGVHTVKLVGREPNVRIDRLVFAKDLSCVPVDTGTNCAPGATPTPDPPPPATDTTAPKVIETSTVPAANATGVDRTTNVTATFSEDMLASSINGTTFKLFRKGSTTKITATVSYPDSNSPPHTAKLDPANSLRSGVTYKAVVTTGAKDLAGNSLDQNSTTSGSQQMVWFFTAR
jgi:Big-like domain-containing protein